MNDSLPLATSQIEHLSIVYLFLLLNPIPIFTVSSSIILSFCIFIAFLVLQQKEGLKHFKAYGPKKPYLGTCPALSFNTSPLHVLRLSWLLSSSIFKQS